MCGAARRIASDKGVALVVDDSAIFLLDKPGVVIDGWTGGRTGQEIERSGARLPNPQIIVRGLRE